MLLFGTSICANAQEGFGVYGIALGAQNNESAPSIDSLAAVENIINEKPDFEIVAEKITDNKAILSWHSSEAFLVFTINKFNIITMQWEEYTTTNECRAEITGLLENTQYSFSVSNSATGEELGIITFTTGVKKAEVIVKNRTSKQVELQIEHPASATEVYLYKSKNGKNFSLLADVTGRSYVDTDVKEATAYYYKAKCVSRRGNTVKKSEFSKVTKAVTLKNLGKPSVDGTTKTYAYYTAVTARRSPQYKLLHSEECYTDEETGIRMVDGFYCVALGSYYGTKIGTKYKITLEGGKEINVILCDQKSNRHTDSKHQYARRNKDVVEFYVEKRRIPAGVRGDYGRLEQFSGKIVSIEKYVED